MDDSQDDQLSDIHEEVKGSHAQLGRIDERTRNIENQLDSLAEEAENNSDDIEEVRGKVKRNTTILTGATGTASLLLVWFMDKIGRLF